MLRTTQFDEKTLSYFIDNMNLHCIKYFNDERKKASDRTSALNHTRDFMLSSKNKSVGVGGEKSNKSVLLNIDCVTGYQ